MSARSAGAAQLSGEDTSLAQGVDAFLLGQTTPDAVRLPGCERMLTALDEDGARGADGFRGLVAPAPGRTALAVRVKEDRRLGTATCPVVLPHPQVHDWTRQS